MRSPTGQSNKLSAPYHGYVRTRAQRWHRIATLFAVHIIAALAPTPIQCQSGRRDYVWSAKCCLRQRRLMSHEAERRLPTGSAASSTLFAANLRPPNLELT